MISAGARLPCPALSLQTWKGPLLSESLPSCFITIEQDNYEEDNESSHC